MQGKFKVLGKGAFGKVMLVRANDTKKIYAMKALSKQVLLERNEVAHTKTERRALSDTHHPFLVHLRFAFQTPTKLYLVMDYCNGGELFFHLKQAGRFEEPRARLYAAEIASALEHLHSRKIVYRDLKPENVLLDSAGHPLLADMGFAQQVSPHGRTHSRCGSEEYAPPELLDVVDEDWRHETLAHDDFDLPHEDDSDTDEARSAPKRKVEEKWTELCLDDFTNPTGGRRGQPPRA